MIWSFASFLIGCGVMAGMMIAGVIFYGLILVITHPDDTEPWDGKEG